MKAGETTAEIRERVAGTIARNPNWLISEEWIKGQREELAKVKARLEEAERMGYHKRYIQGLRSSVTYITFAIEERERKCTGSKNGGQVTADETEKSD